MKQLLPEDEWEDFLASFQAPQVRGLRLNLHKILDLGDSAFYRSLVENWGLVPVPGASSVRIDDQLYYREFFIDEEKMASIGVRPGLHPYHEAGLYYIQGPEAMQVVTGLAIRPFDRVIDLCASPGGKTTQAADMLSLDAGGFIIANEYVQKRARTLSSNVERMGIRNCAVINEDTAVLRDAFPSYFTRVIVDAPCSGEGMFRKDDTAVAEWSPENVERCVVRQKEILTNACAMLSPGGLISYSTCTFEKAENEDMVDWLLSEHPELSLAAMRRFWPHKDRGEGHFAAVLKKAGSDGLEACEERYGSTITHGDGGFDAAFYRENGKKGMTFFEPKCMPSLKGLRTLRCGVQKEEDLGKRTEPVHAFSHIFAGERHAPEALPMLSFPGDSPELTAYLRGLEIMLPEDRELKGFCMIAADGLPVGLGKAAGGRVKNHYPKGLRRP